MANWLLKCEPDCYSFDDLVRDGRTTWDGVGNALAVKHLRVFRSGDAVLYYHTGKVKAIVGVGAVGAVTVMEGGEPVVEIVPVRPLDNTVTLAAVKADACFADWELVRQSRLSVMPVPAELWAAVLELAGGSE
jgi:predicted RNA-binding protein with PUA-like domain